MLYLHIVNARVAQELSASFFVGPFYDGDACFHLPEQIIQTRESYLDLGMERYSIEISYDVPGESLLIAPADFVGFNLVHKRTKRIVIVPLLQV